MGGVGEMYVALPIITMYPDKSTVDVFIPSLDGKA